MDVIALRDSGQFKEAAIAAEEAINLDPALSMFGVQLLSSIYFAAMCNEKDSEVGDAPRRARTTFHGMEQQIRAANPSLLRSIYEEPSEEELEYLSRMRGCTLAALECSYAHARELAKVTTEAVLRAAKRRSRESLSALDILATIRMMDEMYGPTGDDHDPVFANWPPQNTQGWTPRHSEILEEMIQLREASHILFSNAVFERISGMEATILMKKKTAGLVGGGSRVFPVSDTANEAEICRWLNHPGMDSTKILDRTAVDMAEHAHVPTKMMERIMRTLLQQDYEACYQIADSQLRHRRQLLP